MIQEELTEALEGLVQTLEDGRKGFEMASERLANDGLGVAADLMGDLAEQRRMFSEEIRGLASDHGVSFDDGGSFQGTLQRGWMALRDTLSGDDPYAVLAVAESGEDHAVAEYRKTLVRDDLGELRPVIESQAIQVQAAHDQVRDLRDAAR